MCGQGGARLPLLEALPGPLVAVSAAGVLVFLAHEKENDEDDHNGSRDANVVDKLIPRIASITAAINVSVSLRVARYRIVLA